MKRLGLTFLIVIGLCMLFAVGSVLGIVVYELLRGYGILVWIGVLFLVTYRSLK